MTHVLPFVQHLVPCSGIVLATGPSPGGSPVWPFVAVLLAIMVAYLIRALLRSIASSFQVAVDSASAGFRGIGALLVVASGLAIVFFLVVDGVGAPEIADPAGLVAPAPQDAPPVAPPVVVG